MHSFLWLDLQTTINAIRNFDYQRAGIKALTLYSETVERCKIGTMYVYNIPYVKNIVHRGFYFYEYLKCTIIGQQIEPYGSNWMKL